MSRDCVQRCSDNCYCRTVEDIMSAVTRIKLSKIDGSEGLFYDYYKIR